jgi:hypothetical protein
MIIVIKSGFQSIFAASPLPHTNFLKKPTKQENKKKSWFKWSRAFYQDSVFKWEVLGKIVRTFKDKHLKTWSIVENCSSNTDFGLMKTTSIVFIFFSFYYFQPSM